jgi:predicted lipoprotein with Yx(FWY)xxD motif
VGEGVAAAADQGRAARHRRHVRGEARHDPARGWHDTGDHNGHPLYTFIMDHNKPGSTAGEGLKAFGAEWYVLGTNGKTIEKAGS